MTLNAQDLIFIAAGGIVPCLVWLLFWLEEDRRHPEPVWLLFLTFAGGMLVVEPVLKLEMLVYGWIASEPWQIVWWAAIEEGAKFLAAAAIVLWRKEVDEPIDYVVYMVTTALGFSALENTLFLTSSLTHPALSCSGTATTCALVTGNLRFFGATLLHIVSSASIGIALALAFYRRPSAKWKYLAFGLVLAVALHAAFNLTIIVGGSGSVLIASSLVWIAALCVLLLLEKVKKVRPT